MPGTATVTIGENQWLVNVASTTTELTTGLSGQASLPAGTGMLFVLPVKQVVTVQTNEMLFPIDIIFIKRTFTLIEDIFVLSIARDISPGYLVEEATPCDMFLEVNAGEAALVEVGDTVTVGYIQEPTPGFDFSSIIAFAIPLAILAFVSGMFGRGSSKKSNPSRRLGEPKTEKERKKTHLAKYGEGELPERGKGLEKQSIHGEPRRRLVEEYGSWAVGRAEAICPEDDVACVTREAKRLIETIRTRHGEEAVKYYTIISPGKTVFHSGDVVSEVALERENKRVRELGEKEATWSA